MDELWLIDAGRLKRVLQRFEEHLTAFGLHERADVVKTIIKGLKLEPKIDAVPVVRCKDCKHYEKDTMWCKVNSNPRSATFPNWYADDFCSYGERKTYENDKN